MNVPPKEDPAKLELRAKPAPVTRLNRRTLTMLVGGLAVAIALVTWWAFRPPKAREGAGQDAPNVEQVMPAEGLQRLPSDYRQMPAPPPQKADEASPAPEESAEKPTPQDQAEQQRLQSEADAAAKAQVLFQTNSLVAPVATSPPVIGGTPPASLRPRSRDDDYAQQNQQAGKQAFVNSETDGRIYGSAELQIPRSPYQLMAGTVIPAALLTTVNSDLPGQVIASVTEHVYDSVTGRHLLIPQGSRLIGQYDSQVAYGQRRVLLVWTRLIRPDGSSLVLDRLPATDAAGQAGLEDRVEWHWRRILAGAAFSTLTGVGAELVAPSRDDPDGTVIVATRQGLQDTANQVGQQVTRRNFDLQPTLTLRAGFPVRVMVSRDLVMDPVASRRSQ